ncbi:aminotransferase class III-fold pyridoxal phosphate-dependent enzyme, partial [Candidatus Pelagibacter bacterium]|nr:aminotransferase class III-fold pyridoxal phosphate-dependent enzyme [Candidatus Pelagibacter bacterium]
MDYLKRLNKTIPSGAHTYSRAHDQFSSNTPSIFKRGKGAYLFTQNEKKFLDYGMGLRSVGIGYSENQIDKAAIKAIKFGNNLTKASFIELQAAETFIKNFDNVDMVKFAKHGSTAVTGAIKLARAFTKKNYILKCSDHPFFSFDDWFISSTNFQSGIPKEISKFTLNFKYFDIEGLKSKIMKYKNQISCLVMEASTTSCPIKNCCKRHPCSIIKKNNYFLKQVEKICKENKIIFILDEMITGFRWDLKGAQNLFNIKPDISTFGKAMANGFSLSAVGGKRKIMEQASLEDSKKNNFFFLSSTHGSEMVSLNAFIETLNFYKKNNVIEKNKEYGEKLIKKFNKISDELDLLDIIKMDGLPCSPYINYNYKNENFKLKTFYQQEMIKKNIIIPWISISYKHGEKELNQTLNASYESLKKIKNSLKLKKN